MTARSFARVLSTHRSAAIDCSAEIAEAVTASRAIILRRQDLPEKPDHWFTSPLKNDELTAGLWGLYPIRTWARISARFPRLYEEYGRVIREADIKGVSRFRKRGGGR
jgi:hypothetical protein